ncbi:Na+/H+ antiporter [Azomonas macrocytogenes]|uniref:CPA1 family monovalent cation:H+ antiporter n=1 Tax=Azomonas macrocytogenes TaxID=69962 RepID=A0A839T6S6_AZOMA|nr:Na+/H+ antiporter [Azomonas macrocytogenes]MBB3104779.1 CPA1 family monovalent cation:H+ antiporter [Azomonas macrocytogenes]
METVSLVLVMLVAVLFASILRRMLPASFSVPQPLLQIALGAGIGMVSDWRLQMDPQVFFLLFLPPLLFLDGWRIPKEGLSHDRGIILSLAIGLVVFTVVGAGYFINWLLPSIPLGVAFALAAVISPTDPVAVSAIAARIPIPKRLMHILEGESLLNDASGLVCLRFAVAAVLSGGFELSDAVLDFLRLAVGGVAIGVAIAWSINWAKRWISRHFGEEAAAQILVSLLLPFLAYLAAEHLHCSGILAAVAAGFVMSRTELSGQALAVTRLQRRAVWDTLQYALNGLMFVLLGEQLPGIVSRLGILDDPGTLSWLLLYVLIINLSLMGLRFVWVFASLRFTLFAGKNAAAFQPRKALSIAAVTSVAGVRGAISLAGVMTLPLYISFGYPFPARDLVIFLTTGVIIVSLIVAGIGLPLLIRGLEMPYEPEEHVHENRARDQAAQAAIKAIEQALHRLSEDCPDAGGYIEVASRVTDTYRSRIESRAASLESQNLTRVAEEVERQLLLVGLQAERSELFRLARTRRLDEQQARRLIRQIDLIEAQHIR